MIELRRAQPVLRRRRFFSGQSIYGSGRKDIGWFLPNGEEVADRQWFDAAQRSLGMVFNGDELPDRDARGQRIRGDTLMVLLHAGPDAVAWHVPPGAGDEWSIVVNTAADDDSGDERVFRAGESVPVEGRSLVVLRRGSASSPTP